MQEGYVKFHADWVKGAPVDESFLADMISVRKEMLRLGWIGAYPGGPGYGNISKRLDAAGRFAISGTATGHLEELGPEHFSLVTEADIPANRVCCTGPVMASSESMSHAAVYRSLPEAGGLIHIHDPLLWEKWKGKAPTTAEHAAYGTAEMAISIMELLKDPASLQWRFIVMAGHPEGCIAFGKDLFEARDALLKLK